MAMWAGEWVFVPAVNADQAEGVLGNTAGKVSTRVNTGFAGYRDFRRERYVLREVSQKMNPRDGFERLQRCGKKIIWGRDVEVNLSRDTGRAFFSGVETCGNVWACPVCAPKIQARRGVEIGAAVDRAREAGYKVTMFTFTHPHYRGQSLAKLIDMHNRAMKRFRSGRWFQGWKEKNGFIGSISSAEVTLGENGWHWHTHVLYITRSDDWEDYILQSRWLECLRAVGFVVNGQYVMEHGLDIMRDCHAANYLVKMGLRGWGAERELTGSHAKEAGQGGKTPFKLLECGDVEHWQEYVRATKGRKQIVWSKGLKAWACIGEVSDEEIADEAEGQDVVNVAAVPQVEWWHIVRHGLRLELLEAVERGGAEGLKAWAREKGLMLLFASPPLEEWQDFGGVDVLEIPA